MIELVEIRPGEAEARRQIPISTGSI